MPAGLAAADWAAHLLRETRSRLTERHPDLRITMTPAEDEAVPALPAAAEDTGPLVRGSRRLDTVVRFLVGSVALAVVARTERRVEQHTVPRGRCGAGPGGIARRATPGGVEGELDDVVARRRMRHGMD